MNLVPWKSSFLPTQSLLRKNELAAFQREMERLDEMMGRFMGRQNRLSPQIFSADLYPAVDVQETDEKYCLEAEVPGLNEDNIKLDLHDNILTIKGEKKSESKIEEEDYTQSERYFGAFKRDIPFAKDVDATKVEAKLKNGILKVELTKKEKGTKSHAKIPIKH